MTENETLTREELLEAAEFEMLGLLDEVDSARFSRAFANATLALQAEVIAAQEVIAMDPLLHDTETPSAALRLRTLARVLEAIESDAESAAPIAVIGPARSLASSAIRSSTPMTAEALRELISELSARSIDKNAPGQLAWRAASFLLLAALAVSMYFNNRLAEVSNKLADTAISEGIRDDVVKLALTVSGFDFAASKHIDLTRVDMSIPGHVSVYVDEKQDRLAIVGLGFEANQIVSVMIRDSAGNVLHATQIRGLNTAFGAICELPEGVLSRGVIELHTIDKQGDLNLAFTQV